MAARPNRRRRLLIREELPTSGRVFVDGQDPARRRDIPSLRRKVSVIFQDFKLFPRKTVFEHVTFATHNSERVSTLRRRVVALEAGRTVRDGSDAGYE